MRILAIETSCDETAAAVVEDGRVVLSNVVNTQIDLQRLYGGCRRSRRAPILSRSTGWWLLRSRSQGSVWIPAGKLKGKTEKREASAARTLPAGHRAQYIARRGVARLRRLWHAARGLL